MCVYIYIYIYIYVYIYIYIYIRSAGRLRRPQEGVQRQVLTNVNMILPLD